MHAANEMLDEGYEVVETENALEAMSLLKSRSDFDAVVADIDVDHAPGGLALVRYVAHRYAGMEILVTSAPTEGDPDPVQSRFLARPYTDGALIAEMRFLLERLVPQSWAQTDTSLKTDRAP